MSDDSKTFRTSYWWWILAAVWFACWHYLHTIQVWADPVRRVPGPIGDNTVMLWNLGWIRHALRHGSPGFWFPNAYYPEGFFFLFGTHIWLDGFLGWLMSPVLPAGIGGSILWANITQLYATVASGLLVISSLRAWGIKNWPVVLLVSSAAVFSWFRMFALTGHYHFYGTQWMLLTLTLLSHARAFAGQDNTAKCRRLVIWAGLSLGVTFLNDQTMTVFAAILGTCILLSAANQIPSGRWTWLGLSTGMFFGASLVSASIHIIPILIAAYDGTLKYAVDVSYPRIVDASSLVIPPAMHWLGSALAGFRDTHDLKWSEGTYLGIVPTALLTLLTIAALRFALSKPGARPAHLRLCFYTGLGAWIFVLLALGDTLVIGNESYYALPGRLLKSIPVLNNIRLPQRWIWPAQLCIALGGAYTLWYLMQTRKNRWMRWTVLIAALIPPLDAISYPPMPPVDFRHDYLLRPPGLIESVQQHYKSGGVFLMPVEVTYAHSNLLQFQWGYDIPITVAYTARMPFKIQELPWYGNKWNSKVGEWLKDREVTLIVFPFHDGPVEEFRPWLEEAKKVIPELVAVNRFGELLVH